MLDKQINGEVDRLKRIYPVVITQTVDAFVVYVPDLKITTQGRYYFEAVEMAFDAIGLWGINEEDAGRKIPKPADELTFPCGEKDVVTYIYVDFSKYRKNEERMSYNE